MIRLHSYKSPGFGKTLLCQMSILGPRLHAKNLVLQLTSYFYPHVIIIILLCKPYMIYTDFFFCILKSLFHTNGFSFEELI